MALHTTAGKVHGPPVSFCLRRLAGTCSRVFRFGSSAVAGALFLYIRSHYSMNIPIVAFSCVAMWMDIFSLPVRSAVVSVSPVTMPVAGAGLEWRRLSVRAKSRASMNNACLALPWLVYRTASLPVLARCVRHVGSAFCACLLPYYAATSYRGYSSL